MMYFRTRSGHASSRVAPAYRLYPRAALALLALVIPATMALAQEHVTVPVTPIYQNDQAGNLDHSNISIADQGCHLTATTMLINAALEKQGVKDKNNPTKTLSYTPVEVNQLLNDYRTTRNGKTYDGFSNEIGPDGKPTESKIGTNVGAVAKVISEDVKNRSADGKPLNMTKYKDLEFPVIPGPATLGSGSDTDKEILKQLKDGYPVLVRVAGNTHTVIITSYDGDPDGNGMWGITDPWKDPDDGSTFHYLNDPNGYTNTIFGFSYMDFKYGGIADPYETPSPYFIPEDQLFNLDYNPEQYALQQFGENSLRNLVPEPGALPTGIIFFGGVVVAVGRRRYGRKSLP